MFLTSLYFALLIFVYHRDVLSPDLFSHDSRSSTSRSDLLKLPIVVCDMTDKNNIGVTVIKSRQRYRTLVQGCLPAGCYNRDEDQMTY